MADRDPETVFNEAVRHVRWDGVHISDLDYEGFVSVCGRVHVDQLETVVRALREYLDAVTYKPEQEENNG